MKTCEGQLSGDSFAQRFGRARIGLRWRDGLYWFSTCYLCGLEKGSKIQPDKYVTCGGPHPELIAQARRLRAHDMSYRAIAKAIGAREGLVREWCGWVRP